MKVGYIMTEARYWRERYTGTTEHKERAHKYTEEESNNLPAGVKAKVKFVEESKS